MSEKDILPLPGEKSDNSRVEVLVKHEASPDGTTEINLMNIFTNMKMKKRVFVWVLAFGLALGLLVPLLMQMSKNKAGSVSAVLSFDYPEAAELLAPDETPLDVGFIMSSHILSAALKDTHLSGRLSTAAVSANMQVQRMLSDETKQQLELLEKLDSANNPTAYVDMVNGITYTYKNRYIITLNNGFGEDDDEIYLSGGDLANLLNNIVDEYKRYFFKTYENFELPDNRIEDVSLEDLDYIEWLDNMNDILTALSDYCTDEDKDTYLEYRSPVDGLSFKDINEIISLVKSVRVNYLYSYVYYNCLTKDRNTAVTNFNYRLRTFNQQLDIVNQSIANGTTLIDNYRNDNILFAKQNSEDSELAAAMTTSVTDYYNELILKQADHYKTKAALSLQIDNINDKLSGFTSASTSSSQYTTANNEISKVNDTLQLLYGLIERHAEEIVNSDFYSNSFLSSINATYIGDNGLLSAASLKKMGIGAAAGLFIAFFIWIVDGLVKEFKDSDKRAREMAAGN